MRRNSSSLSSAILLMLVGAFVPVACLIMNIQFDQNCGGYLKQAADANTVELAKQRIDIAVKYMEDNHLTDGYTSVLWRTEGDNVGYWYNNVKACQKELAECQDGSQLEKSNVLMKVRESLTDDGKKGTELTLPKGISRYPDNALFGVLFWIGALIFCIGGRKLVIWYNYHFF